MAVPIIVPAVVNPVAENAINAIGRQFGYLWNYWKNMDNLEKQVTALECKIIDRDRSINVETRNAKETNQQVKNWLSEAKSISGQARSFIEEHKKGRELRCLVGRCPNPVSRYQFGRKACKMEKDVADVITKEVQIREVSFPLVDQAMPIMSTEGFFTFESRESIMKDIMKALQTEPKSMVGLYGFGGMGKTTLAKQVAKQAEEEKLFEEIVFASVTQKDDIKEIQGQLASMLGLNLVELTIAERANRVRLRLKEKKVLVILDDLWRELDLKEVGVDFGAEHMGCKILLTSRFRPVLTSMGTGKDFNLGALEEKEAWRLFEEKAGSVLQNSDFHNIGMQVARRCQGLPVLIVTVAASLSKRQQLPAWNDALDQLKKMNNKKIHDIVDSAIESISYNHLEKTHKQLFLLCGVMGGVASIEEVLQCSWGLNWFDEVSGTIHEARNRLHTLILDLKEYCLLLDVKGRNSIKMHDVVRDVSISIGRKESNMLSMGEHDPEFNNLWRKDEYLKKCTAMVLRGYPNLPDVPPHLECPLLELFVMSGVSEDSSPSIPESFFEKTVKLKVLGMSQLSFSALPPSLSFLKNLQTLRVHDCDSLGDISIVGELKKLQTLKFANSGIEELPNGIGQLLELRSLDVRDCRNLKVIPAGLIEGLTRLEELYVTREFYKWEAEVCVNGSVKMNASLRELKHLHYLCSLGVRAGDDKFLLENLHFEKLERYEIIVGDFDNLWWLDTIEATRKICVQFSSTSINHLQQGCKRLFERAECLWLGELKGFKNITPALVGDSFSNLKQLRIKKDYEIQYVVNVEDKQRKAVFPCLESLHLVNLVKLQKICNGILMEESFQNLTTMEVSNCNGLKSLFSFSMATVFPRLREIEVSDCDALEAIVAEKNINDDGVNINDGVREEIEFSQLRKLTLNRLPKLKNFFFTGQIQNKSQKSLSPEIHTEEEEEFKSILPFFTKVSFPKLENLELSEISRLKYLLTPSVAMGLVRLKRLYVRHCVGMKYLIVAEEGETNRGTITFPQLSTLWLIKLPNYLTTFYSVMGSNDTATQPLVSEKVSFPKLEELAVTEISYLTEIWSQVFQEISCCNLTSLMIYKCKSLKYVFPAHVAPSLNKLEYLEVEDCEAVETIICDEKYEIIKAAQHEHAAATFMFSKLKQLILHELPKVKCFYPRKHTIECPALKDVSVAVCGNLSTFDILSFPSKRGDDQFEKVMSNLEGLSIRSADLEKIRRLYDGHFPPHLFSSLISLSIVGSDVFPSEFLGMIHKQLEIFKLHDCSFQEIFPYEGEFTNHANDHTLFLPQLTRLFLQKLPELKYICKHDQKKSLTLNILGRLEFIEVEECPLLSNLVQPSTARSLKQLILLTISGCEKMEKIIGDDDDELSGDGDNEIIFPNLRNLELEKLPRLTNFCSSPNYTFNFPEMTWVVVRECPNMKTFCRGTTTTPMLEKVYCEDYVERWEGDVNTTLQKVFAEREAKRLGTSLPSTSSSNHVEGNAHVLENSSEELTELIPMVVHNPEKESEVYEDSIGTETFKAIVPYTRDKGKGKEPEHSEDVMEHSDPSTHNYTAREQTEAGSIASSSKSSTHSEECHERLIPSTSSNKQEAEIHGNAAEPAKEHQSTESATEPRIATEISEDGAEKSAKLELRELAPLLPSTNHIEAAAQVPENSAEANNDATNAEKTAGTFEKGSLASPEETNPPAQTSLSHSTELIQRSTSTVESEATDPKKGSEIEKEVLQGVNLPDICDKAQEQLHPPISNTLQVTSQPKDRIHVKSAEQVNDEPIREAEIGVEKLVNKAEICDQEVVGEGQVADAVSLASQPYDELSTCATAEVQRLPSKVPNNLKMKKARNPIHGPNWFTNWKRTLYILWLLGLFITGSIWALLSFSDHESPAACEEAAPILLEHFNLSKNQPHALDSPFSESDQEVRRSTPTVESEATDPRKAGQTSNHSEMKTPARASRSAHFIPLLSEFLQIIQNQPLKSMSAEHVQFMEDAFRDLSTMNFSIEWFIPYVQKARECLPVLESRREISELESEIAKMEAELATVKEKKKALEEKYEGVASRIDLDKSLHDS